MADDYAAPLSDRVKHTDWFQDAHLSTWAFSAILDVVEASGWQLVILENPLHPSYLELANQASLDAYLDLMHASAEAPHVHYLHMGWDALPNSAFFDFHHFDNDIYAEALVRSTSKGQLDMLRGWRRCTKKPGLLSNHSTFVTSNGNYNDPKTRPVTCTCSNTSTSNLHH